MGNRSPRTTPQNKRSEVSTRTPKLPSTDSVGSGASDGTDLRSRQCWDFTLVDLQAGAKKAEKGTDLYGLVQGVRVLVANTKMGALGFVPSGTAKEIIQAASRRVGELNGSVLSIIKDGPVVTVRLCLV